MNYPKEFTLETLHFTLRHPSLSDIPMIFKASQVPGFTEGMHWSPPTCEGELIEHHDSNVRAWEQDRAYCFSIIRKEDAEFIGRVSIRRDTEAQQGIWDLGFFTVPQHQGNDYMTEAVRAVLEFGFSQLEAHKIEASHALWNKASERVLQKNGMTYQAHNPEGFKKNGEWVEENTLGITRVEWQQANAVNLE